MGSAPSQFGRYERDEKRAVHALFLRDDNSYLFEWQQFNEGRPQGLTHFKSPALPGRPFLVNTYRQLR